ncbi:Vesicle-associated membrane protein 714 [Neolecta irregularis DAH-3]|uniref:Synaptobrevin homolog YKT6 n=1 Tax=Neolecta irregularis (strain DAH-3) TaxID=1198029 RepID=A0A1U7LU53_NEOID|nr:Vesicle-associated membrane protein 714 [Neolecta irregularis DAH-3]|eukprot:OLL26072.1 Vesicle-associated membrane protein 714 [Neolecta irregularis DAH-3]
MSAIHHVLIARDSIVLAEYKNPQGEDLESVISILLDKIPNKDGKLTYIYKSNLVHYITASEITYLCISSESLGRRIPFTLLSDIQHRFTKSYTPSQIAAAPVYGLAEFNKQICERTQWAERGCPGDSTKHIRDEIDQVKQVMVQNIEGVLERGERIDLLVNKTDNLNTQAFAFRNRSTTLRRQM